VSAHRRHAARGPARARQRGFALVVVLMLMVSMMLLVATQAQRSASGQMLSTNSQLYMQAEAAAQSVLRLCEAAVMGTAGAALSARVTQPALPGASMPAWRDPERWANASISFAPGPDAPQFPGVTGYRCLLEDATAELMPPTLADDVNRESVDVLPGCASARGVSPRLCKYRITARVVLTGGRQVHVQSEMRFAI
jgi:type II secretory pathway pseudopilin PulG